MTKIDLDLNPTSFITVDAIGKPGERVFYLQGREGEQIITLLVEKIQILRRWLLVLNSSW